MKCVSAFLLFTTVFSATCGLRILGIFPMMAKSHYILGSALMRGLAERGHDVTVLSPYGEKDIPKGWKYKDIVLTGFEKAMEERKTNMFEMSGMNPLMMMIFLNFMGNELTEVTLNNTKVQALLKSNEKFDVVIVEQFLNDAHKAFATHFKAPLVIFSTIGANAWVNPLVGNPAPPSYIPEVLLNLPEHMTFCERLYNSVMYTLGMLNRELIFFPQQNAIMKKYFPNLPDLSEINYNASLILLNSHVATNQPVPRTPNMVEIGGYHLKPAKKLPQDLQQFLDSAKDGVIYFSMGSNLKSRDLPVGKREEILRVFSKLKQKILWKWEDDVLPGQPPNVKLGKWLPQQDILAHPNVVGFITHGGLLSTIEAIYHGVPVVTVPIFADQAVNAENAALNGYGIKIDYKDLNEQTLSKALNELLTNRKYRENAQRRSKILNDRQVKPMDEAAYWIEYVVRHQGATHFRSAALDLAWYQYLLLDVILVLAVGTVLTIYLISYLLCRKKSKKDKVKKQ